MRHIFLILTLCISISAQQSPEAEWWKGSSQAQRDNIKSVYDRNKAYDKGWTLAAFTPDESSGGLFLVRLDGAEVGQYGQKAYNVAKRENKWKRLQGYQSRRLPFDSLWVYPYEEVDKPTEWGIDRAFQRLMEDMEFDDRHARAHIDELLDTHDGDWEKVWKYWNSQKHGQAEQVRAWIRFLRSLGWK